MTEPSALDLEEQIANLRKEHQKLETRLGDLVKDPCPTISRSSS
ncbi:MAG: hypothetical protein M5U09_08675 [Gammaproteobacteria bacterium]|nr:hypothetical protein [Gammaproteobacteria bacterium]